MEYKMKAKGRLTCCLALLAALPLLSCTSFKGSYEDPDKAEIVDDRWNATDARKSAEEMIASCLSRPWLPEFEKKEGQKPVVIVDDMENRSDEHIDTRSLTEEVRSELINSRKVRFVDNRARKKILDEVKYQQSGTTSAATQKRLGRQIGADYILSGSIASQVNSQDGLKLVTYRVEMKLTNIETSEIEWVGKKKIKKRFSRSAFGM